MHGAEFWNSVVGTSWIFECPATCLHWLFAVSVGSQDGAVEINLRKVACGMAPSRKGAGTCLLFPWLTYTCPGPASKQ